MRRTPESYAAFFKELFSRTVIKFFHKGRKTFKIFPYREYEL